MKNKCPYLAADKYCTYRNNNESKHKNICIYSNPYKCPLFREWADKLNMYESEEKIEQKALEGSQTTYKNRIRSLLRKWEK